MKSTTYRCLKHTTLIVGVSSPENFTLCRITSIEAFQDVQTGFVGSTVNKWSISTRDLSFRLATAIFSFQSILFCPRATVGNVKSHITSHLYNLMAF